LLATLILLLFFILTWLPYAQIDLLVSSETLNYEFKVNLDSQSEVLIQDAMEKISHGRTMIIIAHRLSTIKKADKIVVLEGGRVVEDGSHLELSQINGGLYAKLLKLQNLGEIK